MTEINLGSIRMPINSATKTFALLAEEFYKNNIPFVAKRGAGKTYAGGVIVFDPIDVWWGLKLNKDGKNKGIPVDL